MVVQALFSRVAFNIFPTCCLSSLLQDMGVWTRRTWDTSIQYTMRSGLGTDATTGTFITLVHWYSGLGPITWTVTAIAGNGDVLQAREGQFPDGDNECSTSGLMFGKFDEYIDNGC